MFTANSFDEAMLRLMEEIYSYGSSRTARGMKTLDLTSVGFELKNPRDRLCTLEGRGIRLPYCAASVAWNLLMRNDVESISVFNDNGRRISDDGVVFQGADYGKRILRKVHGKRSPLYEAMNLLEHDPDSRRAWVPILNWYYDGGEYSIEGKDVPCTIGFQLSLSDSDKLDMSVVMRSQSVIGVLPYDVFLFTVLQELIANQLGKELGKYEHFCLSAHVYERESKLAEEIFQSREEIGASRAGREMDPITYDLDEATAIWGKAFQYIVEDGDSYEEFADDQLVRMMNGITAIA